MAYPKKNQKAPMRDTSAKMNEHLTSHPGAKATKGHVVGSFSAAGSNVVGSRLKDRGLKTMKGRGGY